MCCTMRWSSDISLFICDETQQNHGKLSESMIGYPNWISNQESRLSCWCTYDVQYIHYSKNNIPE